MGKRRKRQIADQPDLGSTSPTKRAVHRQRSPHSSFEMYGERPQYPNTHDYSALTRSNTGDSRIYVPPAPRSATTPIPNPQAQDPLAWRPYHGLSTPENYSTGGGTAHSYDRGIDRGMASPSIQNPEYISSFYGSGYNVSRGSQLDWNQQSPFQDHQPYIGGFYEQANQAAHGAAAMTGRGHATGDLFQPYEDGRRCGDLVEVKEKKMWTQQEIYLITAIGAAQVPWEMKTKYFPGRSMNNCQRKYAEEVERIRISRKEAGDKSAFALGKVQRPIWGLETERTIVDMVTRGVSSQELMEYLKDQGTRRPDKTLHAGALQTVETLEESEERSTRKFTPRTWSQKEEIILVTSRAADLTFREISKRLPGRSRDACSGHWTSLSPEKRARLMQLSEE